MLLSHSSLVNISALLRASPKPGVANLFHKWAEIWTKKVQRVKILSSVLGGPKIKQFQYFCSQLTSQFFSLGSIKKSSWAISKVLAGQKWSAGPGLATPVLSHYYHLSLRVCHSVTGLMLLHFLLNACQQRKPSYC